MQPHIQSTGSQPAQTFPSAPGASTEAVGAGRRVRTLIVDDLPEGLKVLAQLLSWEGRFEIVGIATDGVQAIQQVLALDPELVLMDVHMPHFNGVEATSHIKQFLDPPVVILVTSDSSPECRKRATGAGADGFVAKGLNIRADLSALLRQIYSSRYKSPPDAPTEIMTSTLLEILKRTDERS